jgi:hypothetical protein
LSVLLRYTDSDYPIGIFKLFMLLFVLPTYKQRSTEENYMIKYVVSSYIISLYMNLHYEIVTVDEISME